MAEPPPYEEEGWNSNEAENIWKGDSKMPHRINIRDEVGASRTQHVAALVAKLLPQVWERAKSGLSRTRLLLMPSDQAETARKGQLVGFPQDDMPILIQLEGRYDGTQFWTQDEALKSLREQMLIEIAGEIPEVMVDEAPLPPPKPVEPPRTSFWGRKSSKAPEPPKPVAKPVKPPPVTVEVELDQVNFRTETDYGLYETIRGRAILVAVDIK